MMEITITVVICFTVLLIAALLAASSSSGEIVAWRRMRHEERMKELDHEKKCPRYEDKGAAR